jgi:hyperosmotically inducible periplasmic protein
MTMKKLKNIIAPALGLLQVVFLLGSCTPADSTIKADLVTKAESEKDFAGVRMRVDKGAVTVSGECATEKSKSTVETTVKGVYGVKNVINNIAVAPVVIGTDQLLKQGVDSVLKKYPNVEAVTKDSIVYLEGKVPDDQVLKLKAEINTLKPKMVDARLNSR